MKYHIVFAATALSVLAQTSDECFQGDLLALNDAALRVLLPETASFFIGNRTVLVSPEQLQRLLNDSAVRVDGTSVQRSDGAGPQWTGPFAWQKYEITGVPLEKDKLLVIDEWPELFRHKRAYDTTSRLYDLTSGRLTDFGLLDTNCVSTTLDWYKFSDKYCSPFPTPAADPLFERFYTPSPELTGEVGKPFSGPGLRIQCHRSGMSRPNEPGYEPRHAITSNLSSIHRFRVPNQHTMEPPPPSTAVQQPQDSTADGTFLSSVWNDDFQRRVRDLVGEDFFGDFFGRQGTRLADRLRPDSAGRPAGFASLFQNLADQMQRMKDEFAKRAAELRQRCHSSISDSAGRLGLKLTGAKKTCEELATKFSRVLTQQWTEKTPSKALTWAVSPADDKSTIEWQAFKRLAGATNETVDKDVRLAKATSWAGHAGNAQSATSSSTAEDWRIALTSVPAKLAEYVSQADLVYLGDANGCRGSTPAPLEQIEFLAGDDSALCSLTLKGDCGCFADGGTTFVRCDKAFTSGFEIAQAAHSKHAWCDALPKVAEEHRQPL